METIFPTHDGYSGIFIRGLRRNAATGTENVGAAIVKRSFTVSGGALNPDPGGEEILVADSIDAGDDHVTQESDLVPRKHHGDVIVLGHHGGDNGGRVEIDQGLGFRRWLRRNAVANDGDDPDTGQNLFGWHPRGVTSRIEQARPAFDDYDHSVENRNIDRFYNAHRREVTGNNFFVNERNHTNAATVEISQDPTGATVTYSFVYDFPALTARYFAYCGCGPDREAYWGPVELGALALDTLVIRPDLNTVSAVWRTSWPWDQVPQDAYRRLVVEEV
jgi:hypothetical protein